MSLCRLVEQRGKGLTRFWPLIAANWPVRQRQNVAYVITAENNKNLKKKQEKRPMNSNISGLQV